MKNNLTTRLAATAWCLSALLFTGCHNDNEPTQLLPPKGGIELTPSIGDIMPWNGGDDDASTRATTKTPAALAAGGEIGIMISALGENEKPGDVLSCNYYTVTDEGKLQRIPYDSGNPKDGETEKDLHVPEPGKYVLTGVARANFTTDGIAYQAYAANAADADNTVNIVDIGGDGKISLPLKIKSGGIHVTVKGTDGTTAYAGNDVEVTLKGVGQTADLNGGLETKTLTAQAPSAIWGDLDTKDQSKATVAQGDVVMELKVDGKTYHVKASRNFNIQAARLYKFNVRVGATSISVNEPTIGDFVLAEETSVEADYFPLYEEKEPFLLAVPGCTPYWIAPTMVNDEPNIGWLTVATCACPLGWGMPTLEDFKAMTGLKEGASSTDPTLYKAVRALVPDGRWWSVTGSKEDNKAWSLALYRGEVKLEEVTNPENYTGYGCCVRKK